MGTVSQMFAAFMIIVAMMFTFSILYVDTNASSLYPATSLPDSFNKTKDYGSYMQNQTNNFQTQIQAQGSNPNPLLIGTLILSAGSSAAISMLGLGPLGIAIVNDFAIALGIPFFLVGLLGIWITYKLGAQIIRAIRLGDM